jgi:hypothetical protein
MKGRKAMAAQDPVDSLGHRPSSYGTSSIAAKTPEASGDREEIWRNRAWKTLLARYQDDIGGAMAAEGRAKKAAERGEPGEAADARRQEAMLWWAAGVDIMGAGVAYEDAGVASEAERDFCEAAQYFRYAVGYFGNAAIAIDQTPGGFQEDHVIIEDQNMALRLADKTRSSCRKKE